MRKFLFLIYLLLFKNTPEDYRPYSLFFPKLRQFLVSNYLLNCGENLRVKSGAEISPNSIVGNNSELGTRSMIQSDVTIGNNVIMGPDVKIYSRNHITDNTDIPIQHQGKEILKTIIGDDVWIGANVVVLAGVKIPNHSIVAAGAIVTKDFEEYSIIGGCPAKLIKKRI